MNEPQIVCPNCSHEIKLTESLAAPLIEATRKHFRDQLASKEPEFAKKEEGLRRQQEEIARAREGIEEQITLRIKSERIQIAAAEAKRAREAAAAEIQNKSNELEEIRQILAQNNLKLADAQQAQADLLRKQRELDDAKRELELTIEQRVQASLADVQVKARQEAPRTSSKDKCHKRTCRLLR
jgi:hypothetical protein